MKVVIDTNVLVSAIIKDKTPEKVILFIVEHPDIEWVVNRKIIKEYKNVLSRPKFNLPDNILKHWFSLIDGATKRIETSIKIKFPRDQKDASFLECSIDSDADYLITGDKDFIGARRLLNTTIISVSQFEKLVCTRLK